MRAEFVCEGKPIVDKSGRFEVVIPPKEGDYVVHDKSRWKVVEIVHDIHRNWLQVVCEDETPKHERRRQQQRVSATVEPVAAPDGT